MQITQWWNFFYLCGSASAGLMGLMFVAVSLGKNRIKRNNLHQVNVFLSPIFFHFLHVFFLSCLTAVPDVSPALLGGGLILSAGGRLALIPKGIAVIRTTMKTNTDPGDAVDGSDWFYIIIAPTIIYSLLVAAGAGLVAGQAWATDAMAFGCFALLLTATKVAWDMFIWIAATLPEAVEAVVEKKP